MECVALQLSWTAWKQHWFQLSPAIISIQKLHWFITKSVQITFYLPLIYISKLKIMLSNTVALEIWLIRIPNFIGGKYFSTKNLQTVFFQLLKSIFACHESGWFINFIISLGKSIFDPTQMKIFKWSSFNQSKHAKKYADWPGYSWDISALRLL